MKLNLRQIRLAIVISTLVVLAGGAGYRFGRTASFKIGKTTVSNNREIDFSLFWDVWDRLDKVYLDKSKIKSQEMFYGAIKGMVAALDDPYTVFLPPEDNKQAKEDLNGAFEGVGIQLGYNKDGQLVVVAPLAGLPAEKAGVKAGDLILKIDDKETTGVNLPDAVKLIRGPKGTSVKLTMLHQNEDKPYEVTIVREAIVVPSVEVKYEGEEKYGSKIAHLKLTRFGDRTNDEWNKAVEEIINNNSQGVVLDLRNNPGGYLTGSVFIASEFLNSGVVVQQESATGDRETFSVNRRGKLTSIPLIVLVNEGSASASEIVAGALQDYGRAKIVGEKTFGKGTIQEAQDLSEGAGLHITTARWLLPKGRSIDKEGIIPDVVIADDIKTEKDEQLETAISVLITQEH